MPNDGRRPSILLLSGILIFELGAIIISLRGSILRFQPPLVISDDQLDQAFGMIDQAFSELAAGKLALPSNAEELGW